MTVFAPKKDRRHADVSTCRRLSPWRSVTRASCPARSRCILLIDPAHSNPVPGRPGIGSAGEERPLAVNREILSRRISRLSARDVDVTDPDVPCRAVAPSIRTDATDASVRISKPIRGMALSIASAPVTLCAWAAEAISVPSPASAPDSSTRSAGECVVRDMVLPSFMMWTTFDS